jgi:wyosine [tRNA(Phe)-imidazoG37] synthetase (radical SAM superfamily)
MEPVQLFTQHSRSWRENRYVYPVLSRRSRGLSIGINLNPDKVCNFDCVYCCVDRSIPPTVREVDLEILRAELRHLLSIAASGEVFASPPFDAAPPALRRLNDVAFSGDGEPTSFKGFGQACEIAAEEIAAAGVPDTKIVVITNATLLRRPLVAEALTYLDQHNGEIWAKLDAGTEDYYRQIERTSIPLDRVLENILACGREREILIQSLFMRLHNIGPSAAEISAYLARLTALKAGGCRIKTVQVYTVARRTAEDWVTPLPNAEVDAIVSQITPLGLPAQAFYGPN